MTIPKLALHGLDTVQHGRRVAESINNILSFEHDSSRQRTAAEISAGVTPTNYAYDPGWSPRYANLQDALTGNAGLPVRVIGDYSISAALSVPAGTRVYANPGEATVTQSTNDAHAFSCAGDGVTIEGITIVGPNTGSGSAVRADGRNRITVRGCVVQSWRYGINLRGCTSSSVEGNYIYGGAYDSSASCDIFMYGNSSVPGRRNIVQGNWCLSNNDAGISVDTNEGDKDTIVSGNVVCPLDTDGLTPLADGDNRRRYGIIVGYNGNGPARAVISGNLVRDIPYSGIYMQCGTRPGGEVAVTGNVVYRCGFGTLYNPADASLRAGIFLNGGVDTVTGNLVLDCTTAGIKIAPDFAYSATDQQRAVVSGNTVARTAGIGILLTIRPHGYLIANNRVINSTGDANIYYETTSSVGGNCAFIGNHIDTTATNVPGFLIGNSLGGYPVDVFNNVISGDDNTTNNEFNSGIWFTGNVRCNGNSITMFHRGITRSETVSVRDVVTKCSGNIIKDCAFGITAGGNGPWLCDNNTFDTVTTALNGSAVQGVFLQGASMAGVIHTALTAAPTAGTWAVGDTVDDSIPVSGAQMGWKCTVAGTPGTWVAMANMA